MTFHQRFVRAVAYPGALKSPALWFVYRGNRLLVQIIGDKAYVPHLANLADMQLQENRRQYLGKLDQVPCFSVELHDGAGSPNGWTFQGLRRLFNLMPEEHFLLASTAIQIVDWDRNHQYCGRCGTLTQNRDYERAKECPNCGLLSFPRISPAIIVLIEKGDKLLLARSTRHPEGLYSVLAGFVEPGEILEAAVAREIKEEVGLAVKDIRYFGSQPWPFPDSLMIAFTCTYASCEIVLEEEEMIDAGWYSIDSLPRIPPKISIARTLIDWFITEKQERDKH